MGRQTVQPVAKWEREWFKLVGIYLQCRRAAMRPDKHLSYSIVGMIDYAFEMKLIIKEQKIQRKKEKYEEKF